MRCKSKRLATTLGTAIVLALVSLFGWQAVAMAATSSQGFEITSTFGTNTWSSRLFRSAGRISSCVYFSSANQIPGVNSTLVWYDNGKNKVLWKSRTITNWGTTICSPPFTLPGASRVYDKVQLHSSFSQITGIVTMSTSRA